MDVGLAVEDLAGEGLIGEDPMGEEDLEAGRLVGSAPAVGLALCLRVVVGVVDVVDVGVVVAAAPEIDYEDVASEGTHYLSPLVESDECPPSPSSYLSRAHECRRPAVGPVGNMRSARCAHMTSSSYGDPWFSSETFSSMMMISDVSRWT